MPDLAVAGPDHEIIPAVDSAYVIGPEFAGRPANLRNPFHYPVEAVCSACGRRIVCERMLLIGPEGDWRHEDRAT